jgi:hypothetical protein
MENQTREVLQQQRLEKRVKIAERLQIPIFIAAILIGWLIEYRLSGTAHVLALLSVSVCIGCVVWRWSIWRDLRNHVAHKSINEIEGLISYLALANASGYKVAVDTKPRFNSLSLLLQRDGNERPFAKVYLSDSYPFIFYGSEVESQLRGNLNLRVYFDQDILEHLAVPPPSSELELISTESDNSIRPMKKEYRICKLKIPKLLLDEGFVVPLSDAERKDFQASYEWAEKSRRGQSFELITRDIEGWELLSLSPLEQRDNMEELTTMALMQRTASDES